MNSSFHRLKALKLLTTQDSVVAKPLSLAKVMTKAILLDGSEFRLRIPLGKPLTVQDGTVAKQLSFTKVMISVSQPLPLYKN